MPVQKKAGNLLTAPRRSCQRAEKAMEHERNGDTKCNWYPWNGSKRPRKKTGETGDQRKSLDCPDHI